MKSSDLTRWDTRSPNPVFFRQISILTNTVWPTVSLVYDNPRGGCVCKWSDTKHTRPRPNYSRPRPRLLHIAIAFDPETKSRDLTSLGVTNGLPARPSKHRDVCGTSNADRGRYPAPSCPQPPEDPHRRRIPMMRMMMMIIIIISLLKPHLRCTCLIIWTSQMKHTNRELYGLKMN